MAYSSDSANSPVNRDSSEISTSNVVRVTNNPYNQSNTINWPSSYDAFITKTNDQMTSVSVTDEVHLVADIPDTFIIYMQHRPRLNASVTITGSGDESALINTIDYTTGAIQLHDYPTGDADGNVTLVYLADPDKYYGEYLTQLQDSIHAMQFWAGTPDGGVEHEGAANANFAILSTGGTVADKLPYSTNLSALASGDSITIASDTGVTNNSITLGNASDQLIVDSDDVDLTLNSTDRVNVRGKLVVAEEGTSVSLDSGSVGHATNAGLYTDTASDVAVFYGDVKIFGDILTDGSITTNTNTTVTNVLAQDLQVDGNTILGDSTADTTTVSGAFSAGSTSTFTGEATFSENIVLAADKTVDGVDLKALDTVLDYIRPGDGTWKGDALNSTHYTSTAWSGITSTESIGYTSTGSHVTSVTTGGVLITDSAATSGAYDASNTFNEAYDDVYADGSWRLKFLTGSRAGEVFTVISGPVTNTNQWELDRVCDGTVGSSYVVYSPYRNIPKHLTTSGLVVTLDASTVNPVICTADGTLHVVTDATNTLTVPASTTSYIHLRTDSNGDPELFYTDSWVQSAGSAFLGYVTMGTSSASTLVNTFPNRRFDSGWVTIGVVSNETLPHLIGRTAQTGSVSIFGNSLTANDATTNPVSNFDYMTDSPSGVSISSNVFYVRITNTTEGQYRYVIDG